MWQQRHGDMPAITWEPCRHRGGVIETRLRWTPSTPKSKHQHDQRCEGAGTLLVQARRAMRGLRKMRETIRSRMGRRGGACGRGSKDSRRRPFIDELGMSAPLFQSDGVLQGHPNLNARYSRATSNNRWREAMWQRCMPNCRCAAATPSTNPKTNKPGYSTHRK